MDTPTPLPKRGRTLLLILGGVVALLAGLGLAQLLMGRNPEQPGPSPASQAGLVIESDVLDQAKLDPAASLRCFVDGKFVGEATLSECAKRNGVSTGSLDVGVDQSGALAAADGAGALLTPLPPSKSKLPASEGKQGGETSAVCWRYAGAEWRKLPGESGLGACAQTLFAGRCEQPGGASYGRWGNQTLRLVPGRIEISSDDRNFKTLSEQNPACAAGN